MTLVLADQREGTDGIDLKISLRRKTDVRAGPEIVLGREIVDSARTGIALDHPLQRSEKKGRAADQSRQQRHHH